MNLLTGASLLGLAKSICEIVVDFTAGAWNIIKKLFSVGPNSYAIVGHLFTRF